MLSESEARLVDAGDVALHVTTVGTGPPLVWLHGGGPGASAVSNFAHNLGAFTGHTNVLVDLPRYGGSDRPTIDAPVIEYAAERVRRALRALGHERVSLVGNSLGGGVATRIAADAPELVERLVLMAPAGVMPPDLQLPAELPSGLVTMLAYVRNGPDRERMRELIAAMVFDRSLITDELVEERFVASQREPEIELADGPPNIGDNTPHLGRIRCPTLLLWGREDRMVPVEWSLLLLHGIDDARLVVEPHCGHWVQVERAERFGALCGRFLRGESA